MPRTTPSEKIQTRAARSRLPQRRKPHWLCLRPGQLHLGYVRRNAEAGHWAIRRYNGGGTYKIARLPGVADDFEAANGATVLSFIQAQDLALRPTPQAQTAAPADRVTEKAQLHRREFGFSSRTLRVLTSYPATERVDASGHLINGRLSY
jgi:hypothetical protein